MAALIAFDPADESVTPESNSKIMTEHEPSHPDLSDVDDESEPEIAFHLTIHLHTKPVELPFYHASATLQDLSDTVAEDLHIPPANQKFLITPKTGLLKPPFKDATLSLIHI